MDEMTFFFKILANETPIWILNPHILLAENNIHNLLQFFYMMKRRCCNILLGLPNRNTDSSLFNIFGSGIRSFII